MKFLLAICCALLVDTIKHSILWRQKKILPKVHFFHFYVIQMSQMVAQESVAPVILCWKHNGTHLRPRTCHIISATIDCLHLSVKVTLYSRNGHFPLHHQVRHWIWHRQTTLGLMDSPHHHHWKSKYHHQVFSPIPHHKRWTIPVIHLIIYFSPQLATVHRATPF